MKDYLIEFTFDSWCQGWEDAHTFVLVRAHSYSDAVEKLIDSGEYENPRLFKNRTI